MSSPKSKPTKPTKDQLNSKTLGKLSKYMKEMLIEMKQLNANIRSLSTNNISTNTQTNLQSCAGVLHMMYHAPVDNIVQSATPVSDKPSEDHISDKTNPPAKKKQIIKDIFKSPTKVKTEDFNEEIEEDVFKSPTNRKSPADKEQRLADNADVSTISKPDAKRTRAPSNGKLQDIEEFDNSIVDVNEKSVIKKIKPRKKGQPKKPAKRTGFHFFTAEYCQNNPHIKYIAFEERVRVIAEAWKALNIEMKEEYKSKAVENNLSEMIKFKEKYPDYVEEVKAKKTKDNVEVREIKENVENTERKETKEKSDDVKIQNDKENVETEKKIKNIESKEVDKSLENKESSEVNKSQGNEEIKQETKSQENKENMKSQGNEEIKQETKSQENKEKKENWKSQENKEIKMNINSQEDKENEISTKSQENKRRSKKSKGSKRAKKSQGNES